MQIRHENPQDPDETQILVEGLARPVTLVHITDSHLAEVDLRDSHAMELGPRFTGSFRSHSPVGWPPRRHFQETLRHAVQLQADALLLTGDIIHFPSLANLDALEADLAAAEIPYLYTPGNHDWHFPGTEWNDSTRRQMWERLDRFACNSPCQGALDVEGVRLIGLDNSNYQISYEQFEYLQEQLDPDVPSVLCMHVPISLPSLVPDVLKRWGAPILMAAEEWTPETRAKWMVYETRASTQDAHRFLLSDQAEGLAALLCGHIHIPHTDEVRPHCYQYCARPGYAGGFRVIRLRPL